MEEVIIIGGGPAGSILGSYLSLAGISNTIIEKSIHPRPHVGESMVTATTRVFEEIGFLPTLEREGFVHKYGATWHAPEGQGSFSIEFAEFPQKGIEQSYTYHVDRSRFDLLLLKHAEALGSKIYQGVTVTKVLMENDAANGVQARLGDRNVSLASKIVVDASGRGTLLGRQLRLKKKDPLFDQYAVHAWFEGVNRGGGEAADHIHIYFLPVERGWAWQIPISDRITSMGVVVERAKFIQAQKGLEAFFDAYSKTSPNLERAMRDASQVNEFKSEGDYSYSMKKFAGNGYLMVGDAARFVDPIFSSGVSVAAYSAKFAADSIRNALVNGNLAEESFRDYEDKLRSGVEVWYEFIRLYYKLLPTFTYFIQSKKYRLQILELLQGEVFDRKEVEVLDAMRNYIEAVEKSDKHVFKSSITDIPI